jgi:hypothetical protein
VSSHRLDPFSLVGGVLYLSLGGVGLLHAVGWIDRDAVLWTAVTAAVGLAIVGLVLSIRNLVATTTTDDESSPAGALPGSGEGRSDLGGDEPEVVEVGEVEHL